AAPPEPAQVPRGPGDRRRQFSERHVTRREGCRARGRRRAALPLAARVNLDHPLLAPVQALHRRIRRDVVEACERGAMAALSGVARDEEEGDTIYAIDRVAEHVLVEEIARTIATADGSVLLVAEGLAGGEVVIPREAQ